MQIKVNTEKKIYNRYLHAKKRFKMFVLWTWIWNIKGKIPSIWKDLYKLLKKEPFQAVCKFKKKNVEKVEENEANMLVFSVTNKKKECRKKLNRRKDIIIKG